MSVFQSVSRRTKVVAVAVIVVLCASAGIASAATTPEQDAAARAFAVQLKDNCERQLAIAVSNREKANAEDCIAVQTRLIESLAPVGPAPTESLTPSPTVPPTPTDPPPPPARVQRTAANTGLADSLIPTASAPCVLDVPNAVYTAKLFDCASTNWLAVTQPTTIVDSLIYGGLYGGVVVSGAGSLVMTHSTVRSKGATYAAGDNAISGGNVHLTDVKVYSDGDGLFVDGNDWLVEDSFFLVKPCAGGCHSDGAQLYSGGANFNSYRSTYALSADSTGAMNWSGAAGPAPHFVDNTFTGGPINLRIGSASGLGAVVTGNYFATPATPFLITCGRVATWSGNKTVTLSADYGTATNLAVLDPPACP